MKMRFSLSSTYHPSPLMTDVFIQHRAWRLFVLTAAHLPASPGTPMGEGMGSRAAPAHSRTQGPRQEDGPALCHSSDVRAEPKSRKDVVTSTGRQLALQVSAVFSTLSSRRIQSNKC